MDQSETPPPPPSHPVTAKGSSSGLKFLGIGCGVILLILVIAGSVVYFKIKSWVEDFIENPERASIEMIVRVNPDLEIVEHDDEARKVTLRYRPDGSEMTFTYEDIREGRIAWETEEGRVVLGMQTDLSEHRDWARDLIPASADSVMGLMLRDGVEEFEGMIGFHWVEAPESAQVEMRESLENRGFEVTADRLDGGVFFLTAAHSDGQRRLTIMLAHESAEAVQGTFQYQEKK